MENELKVVDIFIGTTLRGSAKGSGRAMYIMRTKRKNGSDYEAAPQIVEYDNTTESESVLRAIRDALQRLHYACTVVIHTECSNVAAAITQPVSYTHLFELIDIVDYCGKINTFE